MTVVQAVGEASASAWARVFQPSTAHLIRTGNFTTPWRASRSPSEISSSPGCSSTPSIDIIVLNRRSNPCTSATGLPITAWLIIDADDWLIEQPSCENLVLVSHMPLVSLLSALWVGEPRSRPGFRVGSVAAFDVDVAAAGGARLLWLRAPE